MTPAAEAVLLGCVVFGVTLGLQRHLVASAIIGAPWELPALIRLGLSTRIARKRLTELASLGLGRSFFAHFGDE